VLLREEVAQLQEEVQLLRQMKELLSRDLEESSRGGGGSADLLSAAELRVQLDQKEEELDRAKEALQGRGETDRSITIFLDCFIHITIDIFLLCWWKDEMTENVSKNWYSCIV